MKRTILTITAVAGLATTGFAQLDLDMTVQANTGASLVQDGGAATTTSMKGFVGTFVGVTDQQISELIFSDFSSLVDAFRPFGNDANEVVSFNLGSALVNPQFADGDTTSPIGDTALGNADTYFWAFNEDIDYTTLQGLGSYSGQSFIGKDSGALGFAAGGVPNNNSFYLLGSSFVPAQNVLVGSLNGETYSMTNIPEPSSFALIFGALAGLMMFRRRRA